MCSVKKIEKNPLASEKDALNSDAANIEQHDSRQIESSKNEPKQIFQPVNDDQKHNEEVKEKNIIEEIQLIEAVYDKDNIEDSSEANKTKHEELENAHKNEEVLTEVKEISESKDKIIKNVRPEDHKEEKSVQEDKKASKVDSKKNIKTCLLYTSPSPRD
eukprot:TRINITY_DN4428_c0_g2_i6.p3 TRINITY_DN4428_c0_g2~~TRINITY_DN4428_c0_g2_i6.p3  ORF type:complete len:160 (-),score=44.22 TRINITY_DN4428_c0_g2_i6:53-532(-)